MFPLPMKSFHFLFSHKMLIQSHKFLLHLHMFGEMNGTWLRSFSGSFETSTRVAYITKEMKPKVKNLKWNSDLFAYFNVVTNEINSHLKQHFSSMLDWSLCFKQPFSSMFDLFAKYYLHSLNSTKYTLLIIMT